VVDPRLNVYGVERLKVAGMLFSCSYCSCEEAHALAPDLSIPPSNVAAVCPAQPITTSNELTVVLRTPILLP
jgi:hypothetical protein